ncbi:MAG: hypothetical protein WAV18_33750 [Roseiarcus sp.]
MALTPDQVKAARALLGWAHDHRNTTKKSLISGRRPDGAKMAGERLRRESADE